jgi:hypothetical protein
MRNMHHVNWNGKRVPVVEARTAPWRRLRKSALLLWSAGCLSLAIPAMAQTTYYGVNATLWAQPNGNVKMDYDHVRQRFVIQYNFSYGGSNPPDYGTIDLNTRSFSHFFTGWGRNYETLLTVLPTNWAGYSQGTTFVTRGSGGAIYAVDPNGNATLFAGGLPSGGSGDLYSTVRWDSFGVANHDMFYANTGTGDVIRLDSNGNVVWQTTLYDGQQPAAPEPMIVLGSNPRWGPFQNKLLVGQNSTSTTFFVLDPVTGRLEASLQSSIGGSLESFRIFPFTAGNWALYVSIYGSGIYQLTNLSNIPNLQPGDLFVARETAFGGQVWHVYWDSGTNSFVTQLIADFQGLGFLEDMIFAPVPEPSSLLVLLGLAGMAGAIRRRR